jgi:small-conductance mechanosensitive channel
MATPTGGPLEVFGVKLVGTSPETGHKLLISLVLLLAAASLGWALTKLIGALTTKIASRRISFWTRQGVSLAIGLSVIVGLVSVWSDNPGRLTTVMALVTAGVAVAMQRVITSVAGYFLILRGKLFNVGDRIVIGGVRGDVAAVGLLQTTIMEMGEAPQEQPDSPAVWVQSRQYTGRLVAVPNAVIFDQPVYNYSRDFPFIFEEMRLPISYDDDWDKAEQILLEAAARHTLQIKDLEQEVIQELKRRYFLANDQPGPRVYWKITDNWLEMTVRFVVRDHGVREIKDAMSRDILKGLKAAGIGVASGTYDIVGLPPLEVRLREPAAIAQAAGRTRSD